MYCCFKCIKYIKNNRTCATVGTAHTRILFHSIVLLTACQLHSIHMHTFKRPNVSACGICADARVTLSTSTFKEALSLEHQAVALPRRPESSIKRYRENILRHEPHLKTFSRCIFAVAVGEESDRTSPQPQLLFWDTSFPLFLFLLNHLLSLAWINPILFLYMLVIKPIPR